MIVQPLVLAIATQLPHAGSIGDPPRPRAVRPAPAPFGPAGPPKTWYALTSHPGYEGFGALNARGEVVVEWHRRAGSSAVVRGPAPDACPNGLCPIRPAANTPRS
jgi:hypothetical protein